MCVGYDVHACSCIGEWNTKGSIENADAVFVGTIINKEYLTVTPDDILELYPNDTASQNLSIKTRIALYHIEIQDVYKGKITGDTATIYTGVSGGDCGIRFEIGKPYIIFGEYESYFRSIRKSFSFSKGENMYWTDICSPTTLYNEKDITDIEQYAKKRKIKRALK